MTSRTDQEANRFSMLWLLSSVIREMLSEDPAGFLIKTGERLGHKGVTGVFGSAARAVAGSVNQDAELSLLLDVGGWSEAAELFTSRPKSFSSADLARLRTTIEKSDAMRLPVPARVAVQNRITGSNLRIYHYLTNSIPFTHSGYTTRSQLVLKSQQRVGLTVRAGTRLAYPVVVGKLHRVMDETRDGVEYERLVPRRYPSTPVKRIDEAVNLLVTKARVFGADVLHTTTDFHNAIVVSRAATKLDVPWVYEVRGELERTRIAKLPPALQNRGERSYEYQQSRALESQYAQSANAVVALSELSKKSLVERGVDEARIHVVPNAVDGAVIGRYADQMRARTELGLPTGKYIVGTVTSVVGYEGLDDFIRSLKLLEDDILGLIVGDGESLQGLKNLARELGVKDRIIFAGRQPGETIDRWYAAFDVFVLPRKDVLVARTVTPIKPLSALALGIPVVASDLPALREVTGGFGYYSEPENPESLAAEVKIALVDGMPAEQALVDEWLRGRTWAANATVYRKLYDSLF